MKKFLLFFFAMGLFATSSIAADVGRSDVLPVKSITLCQQSFDIVPIAVIPVVQMTIPIVRTTWEYTILPGYIFVSEKAEPVVLIDPGIYAQVSVINQIIKSTLIGRYANTDNVTTRHVISCFS